MIVGYPGHFDLPAARRAARGAPVLFNPLVSLADTLVSDRARFQPGSLPARALSLVDRRALRAADVVVADTEQHARFFAELADLERVEVCFVGAEERVFRPGPPGAFTHALFVGKLIPLHGLETILEAARLAPELPFRVVGTGQLDGLLERRAPRTSSGCRGSSTSSSAGELHAAGAALGIFGGSEKAARVIPNKAFQALACATPLVTADTPAARELLVDGESALLVPPGDAQALADALRRLASDDALTSAHRRRRPGRVPTARERRRPRQALALDSRARALSRALALAVTAFAAGFGALAVLRHRSFYTGRFDLGNMTQAVWSTAHGDPLAVTNLAGEQTSRLASHFDPILVLFAPLWLALAEPRDAPRHAGDRDRARRAARLLARAQAPRQRARGTRLRDRVPALPRDAVARALGVPPRRARVPVAAVRVLVPRRGPSPAVRDLRRARVHDEGGDRRWPSPGSASGTRSREDGASRGSRSRSRERRPPPSRSASSRTTTTAATRSPAGTTRSAARRPGS